MKAFRKFLKEAATENQLRYIWKKEKGIGGKMHFHIIGDCSDNTDQLIELWVKICLNKGINTGYCYQSCLGIALSNEAISFTAQYFAKQSQQPIANRVVSMSNRFQHFKPIIGELARKMLKKDKIENQITFKANEETGEILYEVYKSDSIAEYYSTFL